MQEFLTLDLLQRFDAYLTAFITETAGADELKNKAAIAIHELVEAARKTIWIEVRTLAPKGWDFQKEYVIQFEDGYYSIGNPYSTPYGFRRKGVRLYLDILPAKLP